MNLFNGTIQSLQKSLDYSTTKNRVIANNIANVDTPHYKAKDVSFKKELNKSMNASFQANRTHMKHFSFSGEDHQAYRISEQTNTLYNHNGNNVDVDKEMADLAKNQIYYQAIVDRLNGKFSSIQTVIRGGS